MVVVAPAPDIREKAVHALRESGMQSSMHYPCIADFSDFAGATREKLEKTRQFTSSAITLPLFPTLRPDQIDEIVAVVQAVNSKISKVT